MYIKESLRLTVVGDRIFKDIVRKQEELKCKWKTTYSWLPEEYRKLQQVLASEVSAEYFADKERKLLDPRRPLMRPFPQTTTQEIGWLSGKQEFLLDRWGKDNIMQPDPLDKDILGL